MEDKENFTRFAFCYWSLERKLKALLIEWQTIETAKMSRSIFALGQEKNIFFLLLIWAIEKESYLHGVKQGPKKMYFSIHVQYDEMNFKKDRSSEAKAVVVEKESLQKFENWFCGP